MGGWGPALPGGVCPPSPRALTLVGGAPALAFACPPVCVCSAAVLAVCGVGSRGWRREEDDLAFVGRALDATPAPAGVRSPGSQGSREAAWSGIIILTIAIIIRIS